MATRQEHISRLQEAQDLLREALDILRDVSLETDSRSAAGYLIPAIEMSIDDNHDFIGYHYNIQDWINDLGDNEVYGFEDEDALTDEPHPSEMPYIPPTDPATFPHTPEFADKLYAKYGESNQRINAIRDYRIEYGGTLKEAKDAVEYIWKQGEQS